MTVVFSRTIQWHHRVAGRMCRECSSLRSGKRNSISDGENVYGAGMTELVVGKRLLGPILAEPLKVTELRRDLLCEPEFKCKIQTHISESTKHTSSVTLPDFARFSLSLKVDQRNEENPEWNSLVATEHGKEAESVQASQKEVFMHSSHHEVLSPKAEHAEAALSVPYIPCFVESAGMLCENKIGTTPKESEESEQNAGDDAESSIINTDTAIGKSVAIIMGQKVPKFKNIFDLMDDAGARLMKSVLRKKPQPSIQIESMTTAFENPKLDSLPCEITTNAFSDSNTPILPILRPEENVQYNAACEGVPLSKLLVEHSSQFDNPVACVLPPIVSVNQHSATNRENRASHPLLHNRALKESMRLKFEKFRMGEGRFNFDDIEAKSKAQLIEDLRQSGDRTDTTQLQKQSKSKLKELLKERLQCASSEMKARCDGDVPYFRSEHFFSKHAAPQEKLPSPESIQKWHAAAKKAGVPIEALKSPSLMRVSCDQESGSTLAESRLNCVDATITLDHVWKPSSRSLASLIPRTVNPEHMELLLSRKPPRMLFQPPISVAVHVPSRIAQNDILWKQLCPFH